MPELPEVETIRRGLSKVLRDKKIKTLKLRLPKLSALLGPSERRSIAGATVQSVKRRGKVLLIGLSTGSTLIIHLKMTGQLIFREHAKVVLAGGHPIPTVTGDLPSKVTHAIFRFGDGSELFFNDLRQFGYIRLIPNEDLAELPTLKTFGPEPLSRAFTYERFDERLARRPNTKLKPLLLDQTFIAGLGNIYVDEALNLAKLHPLRTAGSLRRPQRQALYKAIIQVLKLSLRYGGTSDSTYVTVRGGKGDYLTYARVYHRTGKPCRACGTLIRRIKVAGRGTHYCPRCQPTPRLRPAGQRPSRSKASSTRTVLK